MAACRVPLLLLLISFAVRTHASALPSAAQSCKAPAGRFLTPCFCDDACDFYGDCCDRYRRPERLFSCVNLFQFPSVNRRLWGKSGLVIDKCPAGTPSKLKALCQRSLAARAAPSHTTTPVFRPGMLFRNAYCAACNGFTDWRFPKLQLQCNDSVRADEATASSQALVESGTCDFVLFLPSSAVRDCSFTGRVVSSCPDRTDGEAAAECDRGPTAYTLCQEARGVFRNEGCARCRGKCTPARRRPPANIGAAFMRPQIRVFAMNYRYDLLLDFRPQVRQKLRQRPPKPRGGDLLLRRDEGPATNHSAVNSSGNDSVAVLPDMSRPESSAAIFSSIVGRLSFVGCALSTIALTVLIVTYACISELLNLAGLLTLMLAVSLLLALLCFLVKLQLAFDGTACLVIAVLTHFLYICSFSWMTLLAVDLLRSFSDATGSYRGRNRCRRFARYSLVGWTLPLSITGSALLCDYLAPEHFLSPRFGQDQLCFLSSLYGLVLFFFTPISLSVAINLVITAVLFRTVYVSAASSAAVDATQTRKQVLCMCLKVTFVFGLTWALSLAAAATHSDPFRAVCGFINSLQGVFIAVAFMSSQRVARTIRSTAASTYASIASEGRHRVNNAVTNSSVDYLNMRRIQ